MKKQKSQKGFTIAEMLVVVAILVILLTFAAPAVIRAFVRLHLRSLDNSACSIFAAAQNSMTAMVGNGELETFARGEHADKLPEGVEPSDFGTHSGYNVPGNLRYLDSGNADHIEALKKLLPGGSIESKLAEHRYIVEYNYRTGAVYAVWYSDEKAFDDTDTTPYNADFAGQDRDFEKRVEKSPLVGYYGGSGVDYAKVGQMPIPELTLTNAEELRLHIKMPGTRGDNSYGAAENIGLEITLTGETSGAEKTILGNRDGTTGALPARLGEGYTADLMLDTLKNYPLENYENSMGWTAGKQFKDWVNGSGLLPGEDITVTVTTYYAGDPDNGLYLSQSASVSTNSLFAHVTENTAPAAGYTAQIAYGRHLQNLNSETSGVDPTAAAVSITAAKQTQAIDFSQKAPTTTPGVPASSPADDPIYYWASTYEKTDSAPAYRAFVPIETRVAYDGQGLPIRRLYSESAGGLFGAVDGDPTGEPVEWNNIVLIDTKVKTEEAQVGALAGQVTNAHIKNCQVYLEDPTPYSAPDHLTPDPWLETSSHTIGGLVGQVKGADNAITDSFAATVVSGDHNVGGLVGSMYGNSALTVTRSYAACHLTATNPSGIGIEVSGLVNAGNSGLTLTVANSYAAGIITGGNSVAGLVKAGSSRITINDSYAAVRYGELLDGANIYGTTQLTNGSGDHVYYIGQSGITYNDTYGTKLSSKDLSEMPATDDPGVDPGTNTLGGDWYHLPAEKEGATPPTNPTYAAFPYNQTKETAELSTPYPYPQLLTRDAAGNPIKNSADETLPMLHYGDWLESEEAGALLVYFEQYKPKTGETLPGYGFYALELTADTNGRPVVTNEPLLNTLHADGDPDGDIVTVDGYLLVSPAELTGTEYKIDGTAHTDLTSEPDTDLTDALAAALAAQDGFEEYKNVYTFHTDDTPVIELYHALELNGQTFYYNPHFACEAYTVPVGASDPAHANPLAKPGAAGETSTDPAGGYAGSVVLRSARQLAYMAVYTNGESTIADIKSAAQRWTWNQLLDIDNAAYTGAITAGGTGTGTSDKVGTENNPQRPAVLIQGQYNGNNHRIKDLYLGGWTLSGSSSTVTYAGLFGRLDNSAAVNDLTLDTVTVSLPEISNRSYTGALAGHARTSSKIENCTVVDGRVTVITAPGAGKDSIVGALVGFVDSAMVTNCGAYVRGASNYTRYNVSTASSNSGTGSTIAGGLIGLIQGGTVSSSYAAVQVTDTTSSSVVGGFVGKMYSGTVTNCYAGGHTEGGIYSNAENSINVQGRYAGGFVGSYSGGTFTGVCYSTCSVRTTGSRVGMFIGFNVSSTGRPARPTGDDMLYATGAAFNNARNAINPRDESYLQPVKDVLVRNADDQAAAYPYDVDALGDKFPYKTNLTEHHGDWLELRMAAAFYWEKEGDAYNFELTGIDTFGQTRTLTLPEHGHDSNAITEWGYGIIKPSADSSVVTADSQGTSYVNETLVAALQDALKLPDLAAANITLWGAQDISTAADKTATTTVTVSIKGSSYGGSDKTYTLNRAFAAAIQEKDSTSELGSEEHPYQIRTLGQLKNINNAKGLYFKQTHDLNVDAHNSTSGVSSYKHKPLVLVSGGYDGGGYRILNMEIAGGTEEAGLFWKVGEGGESVTGEHKVMLENIVLYAPDGYKYNTISTSGDGKAAGGLLGAVLQTADVTIDNCVVAGYTIYSSQRDAAGGLVGSSYGQLTITNSQAVVDFRHYNSNTGADSGAGPGLGGLVGYVFGEKDNKTSVTITNSYAGGRLVKSVSTGVVDKPVDYAGGLIGNIAYLNNGTATVNVTNSYAYMTGTKYGISYEGPNRNVTVANCAYLKTSNDQIGDGAVETNDALAEWASEVTDGGVSVFSTADKTYAPARTLDYYANGKGLEANDKPPEYPAYPFGAVVKDPLNGDNPVHYGTWPLYRAAGVIYWEKNVDGSCSFYLIGHNTLGRTLTQSLPENGPAIAEWGYGIFDTCAAENGWAVTVSSSSIDHLTGTPADANDIAAALNEALHLKEGTLKEGITVTLWKGMDLSNPYPRYSDDDKLECSVYVTVDRASLGTASFESYNLYLAFAASIKEYSNGSYEGSPLGYEANPLLIRTVDQLRNINNSYNLYFKQARDLDLNGIPYEPIWLNGGGYDGGGYRILNLNVTTDDYAAGLFGWVGYTSNSNVHRRVALKNIILYAPGGDGTIEATNSTTGAAGGLVGYIYDRAQVTIDNCVVAGYTISSAGDLAGGLVGATSACELTVLKSQAVVDLVCHDMASSYSSGPGLGGLVGYMSGDYDNRNGSSITVTNSYAGGRVVNTAGNPVESGYAGGLVGHVAYLGPETSVVSTKVDIDHSYTYMTGTKYGISHDGYEGLSPEDQAKFKGAQVTVTDCAYLKTSSGQTQPGTVSNVNAEVTINDLADWTKTLTDSKNNLVFSTAGKTYVPTKVIDNFVNSSDGLAPYGTSYPFGAIVTDGSQAIHYGTWPMEAQFISAPPVEDGPGIIELTCICTEKCTADSICETCPVCSVDYNACQPTDPAGDDLTEGDDLTGGEPTPEPTASPDPNAAPVEGEPTPTPGSTPDPAATPEPEASPAPEVTPEPEPAPEPEVTPEPEPEPPPEPETTPAPETPPEPSESNTTPAPAGDDTSEPTPTEGAPADPDAASGTTGEGGSPE